ncbi:MAG: NYN domain-containing protein [Sphingomonas sanxanigenens]|uniref:NYN domain-containing protein n=1 Tax=Sphingomonas sanxanigenens TaxID=397260 RepID=A0A2W5A7I8_9SPHN|nr:MAG: NYN domain-containing protein [Sphingomonas sanxanigenens]
MQMKTALFVDGGYLRACSKGAGHVYDNAFIEKFAHSCFIGDEYLFRIFYYDAPEYKGKVTLPVSGGETTFQSSDKWLTDLAKLERFAVRRGTIGFRGWRPKNIPIAGAALTDGDFAPAFEQKGVDMRIGLDIATFSDQASVHRVVLVSGDTDMIPAMKHARKAGLEVGLIQLAAPAHSLHNTLKAHSDFVRHVGWPDAA